MKKNKFMLFALMLLIVALCCGCTQTQPASNGSLANDPGSSSTLTLSHSALELPLHNARGVLYHFNAADSAVLEWSSDDPSVVDVLSIGHLIPVSEGTARVTCTDGVNTASCLVTIRDVEYPDYAMRISDKEISAQVGDSGSVEYTYAGPGSVAVFSSHPEILRVENGQWEAVAAGSAYITCTDGLKHSQCRVTVTDPAA